MPDRPPLPEVFRKQPLAHRGLHNASQGIIENTRRAFAAATAAGYGIELDVQMAADGEAMVFHDHDLHRLTDQIGNLRGRSGPALGRIKLRACDEFIPTLAEIFTVIAGRVPVLIEIKDHDGALGPAVGALEARVAELANTYAGPLAVMSFNPHAVAAFASVAQHVPVGLTTCNISAVNYSSVPEGRRGELAAMSALSRVGASFISHDKSDLQSSHVARAKERGLAILCWTVRSSAEESEARKFADNITFEGYTADLK